MLGNFWLLTVQFPGGHFKAGNTPIRGRSGGNDTYPHRVSFVGDIIPVTCTYYWMLGDNVQ